MRNDRERLASLVRSEVSDERVVSAFEATDRADYVPERYKTDAYLDRPIPIPEKQTTSQPSLIARMVEAARVAPTDRVLEVGTGYGFQTALLARLASEVYSIDRFDVLVQAARANLEQEGISNATVVVGDGWSGYEPAAPYDAIVVSAAASDVPQALVDQLAEGGRLVIPVKQRGSDDVLLFFKRDGRAERIALLTPARFVPLVKGPAR